MDKIFECPNCKSTNIYPIKDDNENTAFFELPISMTSVSSDDGQFLTLNAFVCCDCHLIAFFHTGEVIKEKDTSF